MEGLGCIGWEGMYSARLLAWLFREVGMEIDCDL